MEKRERRRERDRGDMGFQLEKSETSQLILDCHRRWLYLTFPSQPPNPPPSPKSRSPPNPSPSWESRGTGAALNRGSRETKSRTGENLMALERCEEL